jgi:hypothetical protein
VSEETAPQPASYVPPAYQSAPQRRVPPALVAILAFGGIAALLGLLYLYVLPGNKETSAATTGAPVEQPGPAGSASPVHPLAKHLEVAGLRLEGVKAGQLRIRFVVVNHSAADLPEMKMAVILRSADRIFFEFPADVPSLGPFEVKDMSATTKTELKPYELPDWQLLRPQFRIETAQ